MNELKELFEGGKWHHCFRHDGFVSDGTYDVEQYMSFYKFEKDYKGKSVLDVGCSDGYFSLWMKEHSADRVCAVDSNKYDGSLAIETAEFDRHGYEKKYLQYSDDYNKHKQIYEKYGLVNSNKLLLMAALKKMEVDFHTGTIYDLKPYGKFDVVLCNDLLEHIREPIVAIEQLYQALGDNGKCIITTIQLPLITRIFGRQKPILQFQGHINSGGFYKYSEASIIALCKAAGFKEVEIVNRFNMYNRKHKLNIPLFVAHAYK